MKTVVCCAALLLACGAISARADECCESCGCNCCCQKICKCVPEVKKVPKITYECKCEDFCVPGPSEHCVTYDECGCKQHVYTPTCAEVRTRKKLVKHETIKEVPGYKWVVVCVCDACAHRQAAEQAANPQTAGLKPPAELARVAYNAPISENAPAKNADADQDTGSSATGAGTTSGIKSSFKRILQPFFSEK